MELQELYKHLKALGMPIQYYHFQEGQVPELPYILYYNPKKEFGLADNINYIDNRNVVIEVYSEFKDLTIEMKLEELFKELKLQYTFDETYLKDERMYMLIYKLTI